MNKVKMCMVAIALMAFVLTTGCIENEGETRTVRDMLGRDVEVPTDIDRIVGVEAGALRLLVYMQLTDKVVGVEESEKQDVAGGMAKPYIFAHPELKELPSIGPMHGGDAELIVAADPDVIFWTSTEKANADKLQQKTGIPVIALEYGDLNDNRDDLFGALDLIGNVTKMEKRAVEVRDFIEKKIAELDALTSSLDEGPTCYVGGVGYRGAHGILSTEPSYSPIEFVNGRNVASFLGLDHAFIDKEKLLEWDPEVIFIDEAGLDFALEDLDDGTYNTIDAVSEGRLYGVLPYNWYTANFGTVLGNAYFVASVIYPDLLDALDPASEIDDIYEFLVGKGVYSHMEEEFGGFREL